MHHPAAPNLLPLRSGCSRRGERGEGVISTAIAVLVMAFLGAAMWVTFNAVWQDTSENTENQVKIIGTDTEAPDSPTP